MEKIRRALAEHGDDEPEGPSRAELRPLWDVPSCAVVVVDAGHRILRANAGYVHLVEWKPGDLPGRRLADVSPLAAPALGALVDQALASGEPVLGRLAPYDWAELALDVFPVGAGGPEARAVIAISDPRRRPIDAPHGATGARQAFFDFARRMARVSTEESASLITEALRYVVENIGLERAFVRLFRDDEAHYFTAYEYHRPDLAPVEPQEISAASVAWANERFRRGETVVLSSLDDLPADDQGFREALQRIGVRATVGVPVLDGPRLLGYVSYPATEGRHWTRSEINRLQHLGEIIGAVVARNRAEERLGHAERRFAQVLESAMDGIVLLDSAGIVHDWTAQATATFGRTREEMLGAALATAIHADDHATLAARLVAAVATSSPQRFELRGLREGGRVVPIELSMTRLARAEGTRLAAFARDVTDRKQVEAEKQRAFDDVARQKRSLERERDYLREERGPAEILGDSPAIQRSVEMVAAVAETAASVLLLGESGVGKEVFAAALHARSSRARGAFVKVNCASVPGSLFESEFFGHVKGSFTGAMRDRVGRFELADGGTLFLDEVGEIPIDLQAKLLRVLQEGEFERVGEDRTRRLDVRIVAATNKDLAAEVEAGRFRRDLYFRLGVFPIAIPPLRERGDDVLLLARHFLARHAAEARRAGLSLSADDEARLLAYDWPGNVRELAHVLERAVILSRTPPLRLDLALPYRGAARPSAPPELLRDDDLRRLERDNLVLALKRSSGRVSGQGGAAELLGINPSTLRDRMKTFGISRTD